MKYKFILFLLLRVSFLFAEPKNPWRFFGSVFEEQGIQSKPAAIRCCFIGFEDHMGYYLIFKKKLLGGRTKEVWLTVHLDSTIFRGNTDSVWLEPCRGVKISLPLTLKNVVTIVDKETRRKRIERGIFICARKNGIEYFIPWENQRFLRRDAENGLLLRLGLFEEKPIWESIAYNQSEVVWN